VAGNRAIVRTIQALDKLRTQIDAANERGTDTSGVIEPSEGSCGRTPVGCSLSTESPPGETTSVEYLVSTGDPSTDIIADVAEIAIAPPTVPIGAPVESSTTPAIEPVAHQAELDEPVAKPSTEPADHAVGANPRNATHPAIISRRAGGDGGAKLRNELSWRWAAPHPMKMEAACVLLGGVRPRV
jgi:hypothetical protein